MARIQILAIVISISFLIYISRLIVKGRLREEYSFVWIFSTVILIIFSFWREGLEVIADMLGIYEAPNMVFAAAILNILIYLLHLSIVASKLHKQNKELSQEMALLKDRLKKLEDK